ncbi:hypothetical protein [Flavobacterium sp.]|uniref:hypothetical protein n=1 Tax=Flavobacterium sp. TaxID=239 RepID=UPI0037AAB844
MKTKFLSFVMILSMLVITSCAKDSNSANSQTAVTSADVVATQKVDNAVDDVSVIADDQYEVTEGSATGKLAQVSQTGKTNTLNYLSILPTCVTFSDLGSTSLIRKWTITFGSGTTSCKFRGHDLLGQIILTRTIGTTFPKTMTITYNNFSINGNKLEGTTTWLREMIGTGVDLHPKTTLTMTDMKLTTSLGVYTRNGSKTREMIAGFSTRTSPTDDIFSTYGNFTTTHPNGSIFTSLIETSTPLIHMTSCSLLTVPMPFPVSGILKLSKNTHIATIDYGNGDCNNLATLSIDGGVATSITLDK